MMEPHASIAAWSGDELTLWTSNQMIAWTTADLAKTLGMPKDKVRLMSPFVGGGFGGKLFLRCGCAARGPGCACRQTAGEGGAHAAHDVQQHHAPAGDDPAHPHRRHQRRHDHRDRPRELVRRSARRQARDGGSADAPALCRRQSPDDDPARRARPARRQCDARTRRGAGPDGAGDRHRRDGREARAGPDRVPHPQRYAGRSRAAGAAVLAAQSRRVPAHRGRSLRLERAQHRPRQGPRRTLAGRHRRRRRVPQQHGHEVGGTRPARWRRAWLRSRPT